MINSIFYCFSRPAGRRKKKAVGGHWKKKNKKNMLHLPANTSCCFSPDVLAPWYRSQSLRLGSLCIFPGQMFFLDVYLPSYAFCRCPKGDPEEKGTQRLFNNFLGCFWAAVIKTAASIASPEGKKLNFQAVIKSAASAASLDLQGSPRTTARLADDGHG